MRILIVATDSQPVPPEHYGGIERIVAEVGGELVRRAHEVTLLALEGSEVKGAHCLAWQARRGVPTAIGRGLQVLTAAREAGAQFIHSFGETKWLFPWCLAGGKTLVSYQVLPQPRTRHLLGPFQRRVVLAGCSDYLSAAGARLVPGRWRTAHNCVDLRRYNFQASVAPDAPLVFLSRIDPIKGVHLAIEIAERAGRRLILAGNHTEEGESGRYWRESVVPRLRSPGVEYIGPVNDAEKDRLLGQAAALIVPIQWDEPFGIVFIEALACGTPVISSPRGALPEIVRPGIEGFLGDSVAELTQAVARIGEIDRHACRQRVESHFSTATTVDTYERLYRELLGPPPSALPGQDD